MTTVPALTGAVILILRISATASKRRSLGIGAVRRTLARGSSPPSTRIDVAIVRRGSMSSWRAYPAPRGHRLPYVDIISVRADVETGIFTESNCKAAHDAGKKFGVWTIDTEDEIKKAIDMGVDNYFTNDTALALKIERDYGLKVRGNGGASEEE